ncbi:MAG: division/cell wall cluster transcriptional repressor MraZ [Candidatus Rokuibacteriota bacterium]|nr:MAG: division/cell wall cluster transcriptional repressor MraZ [Candidatus Rokubacteria bacterium]
MFRGRYQHTIDPKGRLSVPAKYRDQLAQYDGHTLIVVPNEHAIEVHPLEEWEQFESLVNKQSSFNPEIRKVGRLYISRAKEVDLDGVGRILLPPDTRQAVGVQRDITLVGGGRKYFEIWDRTRFEEWERLNIDSLPSAFEALSQLGV